MLNRAVRSALAMRNAPGNRVIHRAQKAGRTHGTGGFAMVEVIVAAVLFALIAGVFLNSFSSSQRTYNQGRARTTAAQIATKAMEDIRALPYTDVGIVAGDPVGTLAASSTVSLSGITYTINRSVGWVDDPIPGTSRFTKHYKSVGVVVTAGSITAAPLASYTTLVAPPIQEAQASTQSITIVVQDMYPAGAALRNARVTLKIGSTIIRTAVTPSNGTVVFNNLSNATYDITVTKSIWFGIRRWTTMPEDLPGGTSGAGRIVLGTGDNVTRTIRAYVPVRLLATVGGTPCSGTKTVSLQHTLTPSWGTQTYTISGSSKLFDTINGKKLHPGGGYSLSANCSSPVKVAGPVPVTIVPLWYPLFTTDYTQNVNFP